MDTHWYIAVPGDKDDLLHSAFLRELPLEGEPVESRRLHVEHEARWARVRHAHQVLGGADEDLDGVVLCRQEVGEARPYRLVVINREDARFQLFSCLSPLSPLSPAAAVLFILRGSRARRRLGSHQTRRR